MLLLPFYSLFKHVKIQWNRFISETIFHQHTKYLVSGKTRGTGHNSDPSTNGGKIKNCISLTSCYSKNVCVENENPDFF